MVTVKEPQKILRGILYKIKAVNFIVLIYKGDVFSSLLECSILALPPKTVPGPA